MFRAATRDKGHPANSCKIWCNISLYQVEGGNPPVPSSHRPVYSWTCSAKSRRWLFQFTCLGGNLYQYSSSCRRPSPFHVQHATCLSSAATFGSALSPKSQAICR